MLNEIKRAVVFAVAFGLSIPALATSADYLQEVKIRSNTQSADINKSLIIFDGDVVVKQGSMEIKANRLTAQTNEDKTAKVLIATGQPATYTQMMENGLPANASANEIRYDIASNTLVMEGEATLEQTGNKVTGHQIRYNMETQRIIAEGSENSDERVITILQPQQLDHGDKTPPQEQQQSEEK
ncbi:lipopolysaccharide transport periplasmic protein LptA [Paraferrimonas haliotis]|uniref:Lipopolysaccharide export system protein LptA n=1 Tax=Paraferrimonas haliotis TaxID=2013866 RepID=A0AA37TQ88_9GAMM|nr:lipopolysaccharide transport periplasmic protein LptA [Paraferrimonas haliotis]GLS83400.1 lipopolysaccharide export system protein LptA [Paraferrimonas haliotis]